MKRKLTMMLALVLIVAMLSTTVMAGSSWLFYDRVYSWDNGYQVSKATEYWYGYEEASDEALEIIVYEYAYDEYGVETMQTVTTTENSTGAVTKDITRCFYDDEGRTSKITYSEIMPGETKEELYSTTVFEYDEQGREVKYVVYSGSEGGEISYLNLTEYYKDTWRRTKETIYYGPEKEENLFRDYTFKYNDKEQMIECTEVEQTDEGLVTTVTSYKYDDKGYMIEETCGDEVTTYTYNASGYREKIVYECAGEVTQEITFTYDDNGNCVKEVYSYAEGDSDIYESTYNDRNQELTYSYNGELYTQNTYANGKLKVRDYVYWGETYAYNYDSNGNNNKLTLTRKNSETGKSFVSAEVEIEYEADPSASWFGDVEVGSWYYAPVVWASYNGITNGTGNGFSPSGECTRAQVVTFLYRAAGEPAVTATKCSFVDVDLESWYGEAVLWAVENGITTGVDSTHFAPDETVSRAQFVTFLYRAANAKAGDGKNSFNDITKGAYYYDAVLWAAQNNITTGRAEGVFAPNDSCTRAETVTFLYRYFG